MLPPEIITSGRSFASTNEYIARLIENCTRHQSWKSDILSEKFRHLLNNTNLTIDDLMKLPSIMAADVGIISRNHNTEFCKCHPNISAAIGMQKQSNLPLIMLRVKPLNSSQWKSIVGNSVFK